MDLKNEMNFKFGGIFANTYSSYHNKKRVEKWSPYNVLKPQIPMDREAWLAAVRSVGSQKQPVFSY